MVIANPVAYVFAAKGNEQAVWVVVGGVSVCPFLSSGER